MHACNYQLFLYCYKHFSSIFYCVIFGHTCITLHSYFVSGHYCILLKEFSTYTQFPITPQVENTFINSYALSSNVRSCNVHPRDLVLQCPVPLCLSLWFSLPMSSPAMSSHIFSLVLQCPVLQIQSAHEKFSTALNMHFSPSIRTWT